MRAIGLSLQRFLKVFVTIQVQSSMVHGSRLSDEKCDPAARRCRLRCGEAKSRFQRETLNFEPDNLSSYKFSRLI